MKLFGAHGEASDSSRPLTISEIMEKLDSALLKIFNEDGKRTVLYYLSTKYDLTLEQASQDPASLEKALTGMLGEVGWMVVKKAILEQFWDKRIQVQDMKIVERASLREAFGFANGFGTIIRAAAPGFKGPL
ncbi:MAG TPA: hypothetical protein VFE91_05715 [Nitrososphaerales archaeon]|nr:hypothetical protein [Nitrososphaerales archaeon]